MARDGMTLQNRNLAAKTALDLLAASCRSFLAAYVFQNTERAKVPPGGEGLREERAAAAGEASALARWEDLMGGLPRIMKNEVMVGDIMQVCGGVRGLTAVFRSQEAAEIGGGQKELPRRTETADGR